MSSRIQPDTWTYTSLIATVARRKNQVAGENDPTIAFTLLREMQRNNIRPNGMTYSALIDVCGRCERSDLALQGLRIMLQQKATEYREEQVRTAKQRLNSKSIHESSGHNDSSKTSSKTRVRVYFPDK